MNLQEAVNTLIGAANLAQSKGAFSLKEAALIQSAIEAFIPEVQPTDTNPNIEDAVPETINETNER